MMGNKKGLEFYDNDFNYYGNFIEDITQRTSIREIISMQYEEDEWNISVIIKIEGKNNLWYAEGKVDDMDTEVILQTGDLGEYLEKLDKFLFDKAPILR